jgi:hypothetical protein
VGNGAPKEREKAGRTSPKKAWITENRFPILTYPTGWPHPDRDASGGARTKQQEGERTSGALIDESPNNQNRRPPSAVIFRSAVVLRSVVVSEFPKP